MINDKIERIMIKANYFFKTNKPVHITTFDNGWWNGNIIKITDDFLTIDEYKKGLKDLFLVDIKDIVAFKEEA